MKVIVQQIKVHRRSFRGCLILCPWSGRTMQKMKNAQAIMLSKAKGTLIRPMVLKSILSFDSDEVSVLLKWSLCTIKGCRSISVLQSSTPAELFCPYFEKHLQPHIFGSGSGNPFPSIFIWFVASISVSSSPLVLSRTKPVRYSNSVQCSNWSICITRKSEHANRGHHCEFPQKQVYIGIYSHVFFF